MDSQLWANLTSHSDPRTDKRAPPAARQQQHDYGYAPPVSQGGYGRESYQRESFSGHGGHEEYASGGMSGGYYGQQQRDMGYNSSRGVDHIQYGDYREGGYQEEQQHDYSPVMSGRDDYGRDSAIHGGYGRQVPSGGGSGGRDGHGYDDEYEHQSWDRRNPQGAPSGGRGGSRGGSGVEGTSRFLYVGNLPYSVTWRELRQHMSSAGPVVRVDLTQDQYGRSKGWAIVEFQNEEDASNAIETLNEQELEGRRLIVREDRESARNAAAAAAGASGGGSGAGAHESGRGRGGGRQSWGGGRDGGYEDKRQWSRGGGGGSDDRYYERGSSDTRGASAGAEWTDPNATATPYVDDGRRVYVANLSYDTTAEELEDHMSQAGGRVVEVDIGRHPSGKSRGWAIVTFETPQQAERAIQKLNELILRGRNLILREDKGPTLSRVGTVEGARVFVKNLAPQVQWQELKDLFRRAGDVLRAEVPCEGNKNMGWGTVEFSSSEDAENAISLFNQTQFFGRTITVIEDRSGPEQPYTAQPSSQPPQPSRQGIAYSSSAPGSEGFSAATFLKQMSNRGEEETYQPSNNSYFISQPVNVRTTRVIVRGLPHDITTQQVKEYFQVCGEVLYSHVPEQQYQSPTRTATVTFAKPDDADQAVLAKNNTMLRGRIITVEAVYNNP